MNDYIYIGKIVNTHGIKGELRIISDFDMQDKVFAPNFTFYIGDNYKKEVVKSYRHHKQFCMVIFEGYDNINQVLNMIGSKVYVKRSDLNLDSNSYVMDDLIGFNLLDNEKIVGEVIDYVYNSSNTLLVINGKVKFYVPMIDNFIVKIDVTNKTIYGKNIGELIL